MSRPKLEVTEVWILEQIFPYEGGEILGVFFDVKVAKDDRPTKARWHRLPDGDWTTAPEHERAHDPFLLLTKHAIRTK